MQTTTTSPTVHTNAEIAAKLFIAARTVDPYVSAEPAKLDAPIRDATASPATWLGLVGARKYRVIAQAIWVIPPDPGREPAAVRSP
jgi:hypothetical protein